MNINLKNQPSHINSEEINIAIIVVELKRNNIGIKT